VVPAATIWLQPLQLEGKRVKGVGFRVKGLRFRVKGKEQMRKFCLLVRSYWVDLEKRKKRKKGG